MILMTTKLHVVEPAEVHTHTVIFLHGRDSTATEFASELFESQASDERTLPEIFPGFRWIFPSAGLRRSERLRIDLSQWFDMWSVEKPQERGDLQIAGLKESIEQIVQIIAEEAVSMPTERIILAGISQGCAAAIYALLLGDSRLGGFLGFSSWLPLQHDLEEIAMARSTPASRLQDIRKLPFAAALPAGTTDEVVMRTPVFLAHCEDDEVVSKEHGEHLFCTLTMLGMGVERHTYLEGGHWLNEPQGIDDMVDFIQRALFSR